MIELAKILEEVFSYFYEDHLIIPFIDKYQFVRSNSYRPNDTRIPNEPNFLEIGEFYSKMIVFDKNWQKIWKYHINMIRSSRDIDQSNNLIFYFLDWSPGSNILG